MHIDVAWDVALLHNMYTKVTGVVPICNHPTINNRSALLATNSQDLLTRSGSYPSSRHASWRDVGIAHPLYVMYTDMPGVVPFFFNHLPISAAGTTVSFFALSPRDVQKKLPP